MAPKKFSDTNNVRARRANNARALLLSLLCVNDCVVSTSPFCSTMGKKRKHEEMDGWNGASEAAVDDDRSSSSRKRKKKHE